MFIVLGGWGLTLPMGSWKGYPGIMVTLKGGLELLLCTFLYIVLEMIPFGDWGAFGYGQGWGRNSFVLFMELFLVRVFVTWYRFLQVQLDCWWQCKKILLWRLLLKFKILTLSVSITPLRQNALLIILLRNG